MSAEKQMDMKILAECANFKITHCLKKTTKKIEFRKQPHRTHKI